MFRVKKVLRQLSGFAEKFPNVDHKVETVLRASAKKALHSALACAQICRKQTINFVAKTPSHQTPSRNQKINFVAKAPSHQTPSRNVRIFFSLQLLRLPTAMSNYVRQIVHDSKNKNTSYSQRHKLSRTYVKSHAPAASIAPPNDCHEWAKTRQSEQRQASLYSASQDRAAV